MLRIHFTPEDVGRVRFATGPRMSWELSGSVQLLQNSWGPLVFDGWRRRVRRWATDRQRQRTLHILTELFPHFPYFPDFLTPPGDDGSIQVLVDGILSTGRERRCAELSYLARMRRVPAWLGRFAQGDRAVDDAVAQAAAAYGKSVLEPVWPHVRRVLRQHREALTGIMLEGGIEAALAALGPAVRWKPPIMEADYPVEHDLHLLGRGLEIVPSFFCWGTPVTLIDPDLAPILVIPVEHALGRDSLDSPGETDTRVAVRKLLGQTRAMILEEAVAGATSARLCERADISPASVSHHLAILRDSGLLTSRRHGVQLIHEITQLGRDLLVSA